VATTVNGSLCSSRVRRSEEARSLGQVPLGQLWLNPIYVYYMHVDNATSFCVAIADASMRRKQQGETTSDRGGEDELSIES
jgi:hypothetical protein